ncbi:hypothetical protein OS493_003621 [Desmophyllum pertusum]|uniref:VWFA domain-containing protein n=1 Tax=Desmophyllum pertusum TaxID=174260 RepID=A0A9X0A5V8_9CNID|nr:hypothetical protein OS493_003621 [Desmophyllum pertusum]
MAELLENVEMEELKEEEVDKTVNTLPPSKKAETLDLRKIIKEGNIDDITDKLTPKALTKCDTNALLTAMETNFKLRRLANKTGPSKEEFTKLATSVEEFTYCLLDPLKSNMEARHVFGDSLDDLMNDGIDWEQKKFFSHPVLFNLMSDKWLGTFGRMKRSSWLTWHRWLWMLLNIWCLFDVVMFPFLFAIFYIKHRTNKNKLKERGIEISFLINATSKIADDAFDLMKRTIKKFIDNHGNEEAKYQIIIHGEDSTQRDICSKSVKELRIGTVKIPALHEDLKKADANFFKNSSESKKVILFFTDHKTNLKHEKDLVANQVEAMKDIKLVPVAIGTHVIIRELQKIANDGHDHDHDIIHFGECEKPETVSKRIWHELQGKDMFENYLEYFTTPYFIFFRDTLSYLTLLGLHFALCLAPSSIPFSGLEWAILVFFMGRILMESKQFRNVKIRQEKETVTKKQRGLEYKTCGHGDNEEEGEQRESRSTKFAKKCGKYLSDRWNILDSITLVIYLMTFLLRIVTWVKSASVTNNRALVVAGYLYGLNTMFLTLRAFGHVMETIKGVGAIQIALFHIIGDIATIFWQFLATILAFSIAITKVYMAEKSYITKESYKDDLACKTSGISCWWEMFTHLCWSLLGIADLDPLDSVDSPSVTLARFLFGAFLIMGVILLVNMMIALLSNTYQRVEDNALLEWSFKKAITIQTYSTYHPIPVPLNLISNLCVSLYRLCPMSPCTAGCKGQKDNNHGNDVKTRDKSLDSVVESLQLKYFATYGYSFPLTDDRKMDQVIQETERNRQMANQIAHRTFTTHAFDEGMLPTGPMAWESKGIRVEGCLLACEGGTFCTTCKGESEECHGARYLIPFSPEFPHFEVLIQETEEQRFLGVGVVWKKFGNHAMPGSKDGTVGYLVDEGKIFGPMEPINPEDAMAYRGDLIGCTVKFDKKEDGKVPIVFTLNGKQITQDKILMEYNPSEKSLYPFIGMGHTGIRVLAKMCSSPDDDIHPLIEKVKATADSMADKMALNLDQVDAVVGRMNGELNNVWEDLKTLVDDVLEDLQHFKQLIEHPNYGAEDIIESDIECLLASEDYGLDLSSVMAFARTRPSVPYWEEPIRKEEIRYLCETDESGLADLQPSETLLKRTQKKMEDLAKTADTGFSSVFVSLEAVEMEAKERMQYQTENKEKIKREFSGLQEALKRLLKAHRGQSGLEVKY